MSEKLEKNSIGFIGVGNMGGALLKGFAEAAASAAEATASAAEAAASAAEATASAASADSGTAIFAYDKAGDKRENYGRYATFTENTAELCRKSRFLAVLVKPQQLAETIAEIKDCLTADTVIISFCAGISADFYYKAIGKSDVKVVTVMPNTPAMLRLGASALARNEYVTDSEFAFAKSVTDSVGVSEEVPMSKMREIIAVNGSSPAFIYLFAKGFLEYAERAGIDKDAALTLFAGTLTGSAAMLSGSGFTPDELIRQVSSPGGTTVAGLAELGDLTALVGKACEACTRRAYELGGS
ncbi:pyrroline-5-carboxylate reductase [Clostridia bacterium]|nr:pyrroline-5-carboxylate reductase [Clostridia bacterium]